MSAQPSANRGDHSHRVSESVRRISGWIESFDYTHSCRLAFAPKIAPADDGKESSKLRRLPIDDCRVCRSQLIDHPTTRTPPPILFQPLWWLPDLSTRDLSVHFLWRWPESILEEEIISLLLAPSDWTPPTAPLPSETKPIKRNAMIILRAGMV